MTMDTYGVVIPEAARLRILCLAKHYCLEPKCNPKNGTEFWTFRVYLLGELWFGYSLQCTSLAIYIPQID